VVTKYNKLLEHAKMMRDHVCDMIVIAEESRTRKRAIGSVPSADTEVHHRRKIVIREDDDDPSVDLC
jgi:hypothetical protein